MIGKTISHYRITGKVGAGGMGVVYRAHDPRLERDVAIKVLPGAASRDPMWIERFQREARAAGALNHPNVLAIYDVGTHDDVPYIVTELLDGSNLRDRMVAGDLTRRTALGIASKIAEGLAAAHARRIVHRDLKPANVFITRDGQVKILDFGLAKLMQDIPSDAAGGEEAPTASLETEELYTGVGVVVGTPGYIAPEVLHGEPADHRSDIFSLGVIMYELLAERHPFRGSSRADMQAAILRDDPEPLAEAQPPISPALERIVLRCLEKRPEDRFESAHDLAIALQAITGESDWRPPNPRPPVRRRSLRLAIAGAAIVIAVATLWMLSRRHTPPPLPDVKRLAVLPLEAESDDPDLQLLASGLSMTIFDGLAVIEDNAPGQLWVIATESDRDRGPPSLTELRRESNVNLGVAGTLQSDREGVFLHLTLLDALTGEALRSETVDTPLGNLTTLQHTATTQVAEMLGFSVGRELSDRLQRGNTNVNLAYLAYLKGRGELAVSPHERDTDRAIAMLQESVDADPRYAPARVALAEAWLQEFEDDGDPDSLEEGLRQAQSAAGSSSASPEAYMVLAKLFETAGRDDESVRALQKAVRIAPNRAVAQLELAEALQRLERYDEAEAAYERAINLRPSWWIGYHRLAVLFIEEGEYDAAANRFRRVTELAPENAAGFNNLGTLYYFLERRGDAEEMYLHSIRIRPNADTYSNLGTLAFEDARFGDAAGLLEKAVEFEPEDSGLWGNLASAYYWGGEREKAASTFRRAIELGEQKFESDPTDADLAAVLAGYYGMLGDNARGLELIETAITLGPESEEAMATVAEGLEDLGERERALEWIGRALDAGLTPAWIERRPGLRNLTSDPRFQALINSEGEPPETDNS